jgi:crossover junction endodeoxyribonuclease RuvC
MSVPLRVLGVDPGLSGAVVLYTPSTGELQARRDFRGIHEVAKAVRDLGRHATFGVVEFVSARPGQGVTSMFHFGQASGVPIGVLEAMEVSWIDVVPRSWQAWVREYVGWGRDDAFSACEAALQCAPPAHHGLFKRAKDHNTADAFLLALWGSVHAHDRPRASGKCGSQTRLPAVPDMLVAQMARERDHRLLEDLRAHR